MSTKDKTLAYLQEHSGEFMSGEDLANALGVSRNSVWKAIKTLQSTGYPIYAVSGKGYCLAQNSDVLSREAVQKRIKDHRVTVEFHPTIGSTNARAKELTAQGVPEGTLIVANQQTAGRGRRGRAFYSPADTGVYFSLVLRPSFDLGDVTLITSYAATCVAHAIEDVFGLDAQIKWVNDVFVDGRKCCGILTEAAITPENGGIDYVVLGIGINVYEPKGGFSEESAGIARALWQDSEPVPDGRARVAAATINRFMKDYERIPTRPHLEEYRKRSLLDGRCVQITQGMESFAATVLGINDDFSLRVRLEDGSERNLQHGEASIPSSQLAQTERKLR